ncbi:hypothetical protein JO972_00475 [Verrucomicrobiaceae bacterium 5K15]|uniref:Uncharacterized protein n=1 Tax=Oceaniferula flava TaxID=2800421 RepID=A0AAE2V8D2_9BACT|nr:hypothetical protein [Oceaniferula flavus]MBK1853423.1 hypothetical protein [Oceaniferula flavus]MBM1134728.1 hypothetical protein [Oceaniferula flavus]
MSQQGIFSIAPDSHNGSSNGANANGANGDRNGANGSPFSSVTTPAAQNSPFAAVAAESPFQQVVQKPANEQASSIPQPRAEGESPALGSAADSGSAATDSAPDANGGPFQMNGFPEQSSSQFMEAAPVASSQESSPFAAASQPESHDYTAAKAGLEPQQDFAAVQSRYQPESSPEPARATQAMHYEQAAALPTPTQAIRAASMEMDQAPAAQAAPEPAPVPAAQEPVKAEAVQEKVPQNAPAPAQSASSGRNTSAGIQQLELRAIFGVDHMLSQDEMLQRARTLPGIHNVAVIHSEQVSALSNFRQALQGMGFGNADELKLTSGGGAVDFLSEGETTLAVLHDAGYAPGVQETLIIVAREIGKLA